VPLFVTPFLIGLTAFLTLFITDFVERYYLRCHDYRPSCSPRCIYCHYLTFLELYHLAGLDFNRYALFAVALPSRYPFACYSYHVYVHYPTACRVPYRRTTTYVVPVASTYRTVDLRWNTTTTARLPVGVLQFLFWRVRFVTLLPAFYERLDVTITILRF